MLNYIFPAVTTDAVCCNGVYAWRRRWASFIWRRRCRSAAVATCAALPFAARVYASIFFLCTFPDRYCLLQCVYYRSRRYCTLQLFMVQVGITPFDGVLGGNQPFCSAAGVHTFSTAGLGIILPFLRRLVLSSPVVKGAILQQ